MSLMAQHIPTPWKEQSNGWKLADKIFLEYDKMFEWPDAARPEYTEEESFCYALRNQIGILVDGTVVPCCLDADGSLALGNLFSNELEEILSTKRAKAMFDGFSCRKASEEMCKRCGFAKKFSKNT